MKNKIQKSKEQLYKEILDKLSRKLRNNSNLEDVLCGNYRELNCWDGRGVWDLLCKFERVKARKEKLLPK